MPRESHRPKQVGNVPDVILDSVQAANQFTNSRSGPEIGGEALGAGPLENPPPQASSLPGCELGGGARGLAWLESLLSLLAILRQPELHSPGLSLDDLGDVLGVEPFFCELDRQPAEFRYPFRTSLCCCVHDRGLTVLRICAKTNPSLQRRDAPAPRGLRRRPPTTTRTPLARRG